MRSLDSGVLLIDKPTGMTSAQVVAAVKRLTGTGKVGHTGTLDPLATGLLVCCLNRATRLARFLLEGEKTYEAVLGLGVTTDTQDAAGRVLTRHDTTGVTKTGVQKTMGAFTGAIRQQPPVYSALKHHGKPLHHWVRKGNPVAKPPRNVVISALEIRKIELPDVYFSVTCSKGTYIRTLCADIGDALGCGAHLTALRRTASCGFSVTQSMALEQLDAMADTGAWKNRLISPADALPFMPTHQANDALVDKIKFGRPIGPSDGIRIGEKHVKVINAAHDLLAIIDRKYKYCCVFPDGI
jgi:tRNA pseudouridine55 synthase